jgi:hypothetical protein
MIDHPRDCPHGRQWGKCEVCDLIEAQVELIELRALVEEVAEMVPDYFIYDSDIWCMFCDTQLNRSNAEHKPSCIWLRAQKWKIKE